MVLGKEQEKLRNHRIKLIEKSTSSDDTDENVEYFFMSWLQLCCGKQNGYADHIGKVCFQQYGPIGKEQEKLHNHHTKLIENSTSSDDREKTWNISSCLDSSFVVANRMDMLTT